MKYELGELLPYEQPTDYIVESTDYDDSYKTPVLTAGKSFIIGYTNETKGIYTKLPVIIFDDFTTSSQYVDFPFKVKSSAMKILSANSEIANLKYLFYKMQTIQFDSANHKRYWISEYSKIKLDLPTLAEQERIVKRIETMFAKLDQAQEKAQAVLDSFETRKAAILHKAFTGELTANWRKKNGVLDNSWETKALKDTTLKIIDGDRGKNYPSKSDFSEIGHCVFLNTKNVTKNGFSFEKVDFITKEKDESLHNGKLQRGDVIFTTRGTIGNSAIYSDDIPYEHLRINSGMVIFREGIELNKHFLLLLFKSKNVQTQINKLQTGSAQPQLPIKVMKNLQIPIPSIPEQNEIVKILVSILEKESRAKEAAQTVLDQIALLKKSILARAFRGKI